MCVKDAIGCEGMHRGIGWQLKSFQILKDPRARQLDYDIAAAQPGHLFFFFTDVYVKYNNGTKSLLLILLNCWFQNMLHWLLT